MANYNRQYLCGPICVTHPAGSGGKGVGGAALPGSRRVGRSWFRSGMAIVTIIGGGFSGAMTAHHVLRVGSPAVTVRLVERTGRFGPGLPYRTRDPRHLLNVPAGNMSALPDDPDHFVHFLRRSTPRVGPGAFVARGTYGDYLEQLVSDMRERFRGRLDLVSGEAVSIAEGPDSCRYDIALSDGRKLASDGVVLAFGHSLAPLRGLPREGRGAVPALVENPWEDGALDRLHGARRILLVGTGLTALDVCLSLLARPQVESIDAWSRHGLLPIAHRSPVSRPRPDGTSLRLLSGPPTVRAYVRQLRLEVRRAQSQGADWRDVIAGLRPETPALWRRLPVVERARFLRHVRRYWDVHRHRCAPECLASLEADRVRGRVVFAAAALREVVAEGDGWLVKHALRHGVGVGSRRFDAIVNCTGPETDLDRIDDPLITSLRRSGLLRADPCHLGVAIDDRYRPLREGGGGASSFCYVGPGLRAAQWEAVAVPELRVHTQAVAREIVTAVDTGSPVS